MEANDAELVNDSLNKIISQSTPKDMAFTNQSAFEKELFKDGIFEFDFDKEIDKSEDSYFRMKDWLRHPGWVTRAKGVLSDLVTSERWGIAWKQAFTGKIPKSWHIWYNVMESFEEADKKGVQLNPILVSAGISHEHHIVVNRTGKSQKLTPEQLGLVLGRDDIPEYNSEEIVSAQKRKGMTEKEYKEARIYAAEVREKIRKAKSKKEQLSSPKLQLRKQNKGGEV